MSERYSFSGDRPLMPNIVVDGSMTNLVWSPQDASIYTDTVNSTLSDTMNEGYVTANEENETQYLSVLDNTGEISLENLNLTLGNPKLEMTEEVEEQTEGLEDLIETNPEEVDNQVVVFTMEGSNELYGIQLAQDDEGNIHKYQFQFRKNDLGQLEAIPETVQVLPMDDEEALVAHPSQETEEIEQQTPGIQIFVNEDNSGEHILPDDHPLVHEDSHFESDQNETILHVPEVDEVEEEPAIDIKPVIIDGNVKQEIHDQLDYSSTPEEEEQEEEPEEQFHEEPVLDVKIFNEELQPQLEDHDTIEEMLDSEEPEAYDNTCLQINEYPNETEAEQEQDQMEHEQQQLEYVEQHYEETAQHYEEVEDPTLTFTEEALVEHPELIDDTSVINREVESEDATTTTGSETFYHESVGNDSDNDDFHIVEGVHITGDVEEPSETVPELEKSRNNNGNTPKSNILRHALKSPNEITVKKDNRLYLYLVHPEKENVHTLSPISHNNNNQVRPVVRTNPRSILKTSLGLAQQPIKNTTIIIANAESRSPNNKRFARGKEAMQAKLFNNFINKTTIPQAPIRKVRLPRKQEIKPIERQNEEIVVQEVMVSSNGFVETSSINKKRLEVTEYVDLTDSDDEFDPKKKYSANKRKKSRRNRSRVEITISSDSESDEDDDVIELDDDEDEDDNDYEDEQEEEEEESEQEVDEVEEEKEVAPTSPVKRRRGRPPKNPKINNESSDSLESPLKKMCLSDTEKVEIPCPKCPKTFPSQNSLKTHLQHHNLQTLQRKAQPQPDRDRYKCPKCEEVLKNKALLDRHCCAFVCPICHRKFPNGNTLNAHKRFHAKERLCKMSSAVQVSPKKIRPLPGGKSGARSPSKSPNRCKTCGKTFSTAQLLGVHARTHRDAACPTCSARFPSRILLERHVRENCVKAKAPSSQVGGQRRSTRLTTTISPPKFAKPSTPLLTTRSALKVACDKCPMKFQTFKALLRHQALKHGLDTPDKSFIQKDGSERKKLHKEGKVHSGIQPSSKFRSAYLQLRQKLEFHPNKNKL